MEDPIKTQMRGARCVDGVWHRQVNGKLEVWPVLRLREGVEPKEVFHRPRGVN